MHVQGSKPLALGRDPFAEAFRLILRDVGLIRLVNGRVGRHAHVWKKGKADTARRVVITLWRHSQGLIDIGALSRPRNSAVSAAAGMGQYFTVAFMVDKRLADGA